EFSNRVHWHGQHVGQPDWTGQAQTLAFYLVGKHGHLYVMVNSSGESQRFSLPPHDGRYRWRRLVDTHLNSPDDIVEEKTAIHLNPADHYLVSPRSTVILLSE